MIQDIVPEQLKNQYQAICPKKGSRMMAFRGNEIYVKTGERADFLCYEVLEDWCRRAGMELPGSVYLFSIGGVDYFLTELPGAFVEDEEKLSEKSATEPEKRGMDMLQPAYEFVSMFGMRAKKPKEQVFAAATAWHLFVWYRDNRYCGRCGHGLVHSRKLRMLTCPVCGNQVFPKIAPAVIVGVTDGERILMTKYANREYKRYALIAGFTEIGETAEIRLDEEELATAEWVHYSDVPEDVEGLSLTREMMTVFCKGWEKRKSGESKMEEKW